MTYLLVHRRQGTLLCGVDGYGRPTELVVSERIARQVGERLCYVRQVTVQVDPQTGEPTVRDW